MRVTMTRVMCGLGLAVGSAIAVAQHASVPLWANGAPGSEGKTAAEVVTLDQCRGRAYRYEHQCAFDYAPYLARDKIGRAPVAAVIIAPGGGHALLSIDHEGYDVAKFLSGHGVAAFVLKYRLAREKGSTYTMEKERTG